MFLTTKTYRGLLHNKVIFTLKSEKIQSIIEYSVKDDVSKNILTTVFNQLMENQRTEYIQKQKNMNEHRKPTKSNEMAIMRAQLYDNGTLELKVPRTRDGHFFPQCLNVINETKALMASMLEMYVSGVSTRKYQIVEELCGKSVSKSFVSSLTEQLEPMVNKWADRLLSEKLSLHLMTDVLYIKVREENRVLSKSCPSDWNQRWRP
ncbi:transposase [Enterococcus faecium]|uniref:transposase n=1 Tax=Enterococcus faecium TaxID=1352 RepID=UPI003F7A99F9